MTREGQATRLVSVVLDTRTIGRGSPDVEHERAVAIFDLLEDSHFSPEGHAGGPYRLVLSLAENRLAFDISTEAGEAVATHLLSLTSFRRVVRDYALICDSYHAAIRSGSPSRIEAIDMGRRGVHDDGARILQQRLAGKVALSFDTARRLFTLLHVLHWRG